MMKERMYFDKRKVRMEKCTRMFAYVEWTPLNAHSLKATICTSIHCYTSPLFSALLI